MSLVIQGVGKVYEPPPWYLRPVMRGASGAPVEALRDVSFDVAEGEVVGLVGPNGAGKTTLLKIISTLVEPSTGHVLVSGADVVADPRAVQAALGLVLTDDRSAYWRLDGRRNLEFFGVLAGLSPADARARASVLLEQFGLADRDKRVLGYSAGMRAALNIARATLTSPQVLVLDEPTRSLDPVAATHVGALLRAQAESGRSVLFSSHRLDEVAVVCDRVVVVAGGQIRHIGPAGSAGGDGLRRLFDREVGAA